MSFLPIKYFDEIAKNPSLYEEKNFGLRTEAIDFIESELIAEIEYQLMAFGNQTKLIALKNRAERVKAELELVDTKLFEKLRTDISSGLHKGKEFIDLVKDYVNFDLTDERHNEPGYDNLDISINKLITPNEVPEQTKQLEPEMVYYQKTPARIIFELIGKFAFSKSDVFFDLGSGLGQIPIVVNLLTGVKTRGIEFEPSFYEYAVNCASTLNLTDVTFINIDARDADYSEGSIFFMFTPFRGEIMLQVLDVLREKSLKRKIKIATYGPCTAEVALQNWLRIDNAENNNVYKLCIFTSF
jgi:hypothetical protein